MTVPARSLAASPIMFGVGCLAASMTLFGCVSVLQGAASTSSGNGGAGSAPYEHAPGSEDVLVSAELAGWYGPVEYALRNTASFLLLGDGTAIIPAPVPDPYPGPAINPLQSTTLTEQQIQELFAAANGAGLLGAEIDFGEPGISDQATTYVDITVDGRTVSQEAYALDIADDDSPNTLSEASRAARAALRDFISTAQEMVDSDSEPFRPDIILAHRLSSAADISEEPRVWPVVTVPPPIEATSSASSSCAAISGAEAVQLAAALVGANGFTPWVIGTDPPARMVFRSLLPGDPGC